MKTESQQSEGWGQAHSSHRFHFFTGKEAACGKYVRHRFAKRERNVMQRMPQDCIECWEALVVSGVVTQVPDP